MDSATRIQHLQTLSYRQIQGLFLAVLEQQAVGVPNREACLDVHIGPCLVEEGLGDCRSVPAQHLDRDGDRASLNLTRDRSCRFVQLLTYCSIHQERGCVAAHRRAIGGNRREGQRSFVGHGVDQGRVLAGHSRPHAGQGRAGIHQGGLIGTYHIRSGWHFTHQLEIVDGQALRLSPSQTNQEERDCGSRLQISHEVS